MRAPESLIPPSGTEAAVASVLFALIGQSEKRLAAHMEEMEKLGAGLQHLHMESTKTLSAIRPDAQRAYLFDSLLQDARGRAEEVRRTNLEQLVQQERDLQGAYQRVLDEGLPMISGALDPNQGLPRGWQHQPPQRHVVAAPDQDRQQQRPMPQQQLRAVPRREVIDPRRQAGPVIVQGSPPERPQQRPSMPGPAQRPMPGPGQRPAGPAPSATAAYSFAFRRAASSKENARVEASPKETAEPKAKSSVAPVNGPSAPSAPATPAERDDSDSHAT